MNKLDVLFGRVRELVLSPAVVGLLDARVRPQHLYGTGVRLLEGADLLHVHLTHHQGITLERRAKENTLNKSV